MAGVQVLRSGLLRNVSLKIGQNRFMSALKLAVLMKATPVKCGSGWSPRQSR